MKKKIFLLVLLAIMLFAFTGCTKSRNEDIALLTFSGCCTKPRNEERITAHITLPDRKITIDVAQYIRISQSCTRIQSSDGVIYECHPINVIFITTKK